MVNETFQEALRLLNSLQNNATARNSAAVADDSWRRAKFMLSSDTLVQLGYPPSSLNKLNIIHIAGSKGKGSTAAITASILSQFLAAGRVPSKIGVFTSPHIRTIRERIQIISGPTSKDVDWSISEELFAKYFFEVWKTLQVQYANASLEELPTFFKCLFAVAVHAFACEGVDAAIVECGIGGEYDATNVLDRPVVSAITTLELEHTDLLGGTLESIAWHKAGIMRTKVPVLTVPQHPEALQALHRRAAEKGTTVTVVEPAGGDVEAEGWHAVNAALASRLALEYLRRFEACRLMTGSELENVIQKGIGQATLQGRFELRKIGSSEWYIDGAHTLRSLEKTAKWFAIRTKGRRSDARVLIFNQEGRDTAPMLSLLHQELCRPSGSEDGLTHVIFCAKAPFLANQFSPEAQSMTQRPQAAEPNQMPECHQQKNARIWQSISQDAAPAVSTYPTIREAVEHVREHMIARDAAVHCLVTGSLHLVGGVEVVLDELAKEPYRRISVPGESSSGSKETGLGCSS